MIDFEGVYGYHSATTLLAIVGAARSMFEGKFSLAADMLADA